MTVHVIKHEPETVTENTEIETELTVQEIEQEPEMQEQDQAST